MKSKKANLQIDTKLRLFTSMTEARLRISRDHSQLEKQFGEQKCTLIRTNDKLYTQQK